MANSILTLRIRHLYPAVAPFWFSHLKTKLIWPLGHTDRQTDAWKCFPALTADGDAAGVGILFSFALTPGLLPLGSGFLPLIPLALGGDGDSGTLNSAPPALRCSSYGSINLSRADGWINSTSKPSAFVWEPASHLS